MKESAQDRKISLRTIISKLQKEEGMMSFAGGQFTLNDLFFEMDETTASSRMECEEFITFAESRMKYYLARAAGAERREQSRRRTLRKIEAATVSAASFITSEADNNEIMEVLVSSSTTVVSTHRIGTFLAHSLPLQLTCTLAACHFTELPATEISQ